MTYKSILLFSLMATCTTLHALVNLGEGQIDLSVGSSLGYDSEINARALGQSDTIWTFRPALTYVRPSKNFSFSAGAGVLVQRYFDYSEFDDEDFFIDLSISPNAEIEKSRFTFSGTILLNSETASNEQVGEIVTTQNYGVSGELTYHPNRNYSIIGSSGWRKSDPDASTYKAFERFDGGLQFLLPVKKNISWISGARFSRVKSSEATVSDSDIWTYSTGLSGTLFPRIEASVSVGYQHRSFDTGNKTEAPYFSLDLDWSIDDLSSLNLSASTDMGTTINDLSTETFTLSIGYSRQLNRTISFSVGAAYDFSEFQSAGTGLREDETVLTNCTISYRLTTWGSVGIYANYSDRSSDSAFFDYDRTRAGVQFTGTW